MLFAIVNNAAKDMLRAADEMMAKDFISPKTPDEAEWRHENARARCHARSFHACRASFF